MTSKPKIVDLNEVDWTEVSDVVCTLIANLNDNQACLEHAAAKRNVSLEAISAAAITEMLREHLEKHVVQ
jgi:hypothetical protein